MIKIYCEMSINYYIWELYMSKMIYYEKKI